MRSVVRFEGLALAGSASIADLRLRTPVVLASGTDPGDEEGPNLSTGTAPPGARRLAIRYGGARLELEFPIVAPEIAPPSSGVIPLESGAVLLHAPFDDGALRELHSRRPELLVLGNARALWDDREALVAAVRAIRTTVGPEPLLWGPRVALPNRLPLLAYLGFDLLDSTGGELRAASGEFLDPTLGPRPTPRPGSARDCDCRACSAHPPGPLSAHARAMYRRAEVELRRAMAEGALRELVEARLASEPACVELLRYADRSLADLLEARAPVVGDGPHVYALAEAIRRPEMRRFRERLLERYRPPPSKRLLLLVPCSRTKPYRRSPSHRRFARALEGLAGVARVHVVSVSSPIGVVPRELEDVPPARNYDIPVTGDWSAEERDLVARGVRHLLATGNYRRAVVHLDPQEYGFVLDVIPEALRSPATVVDGRPTSAVSLARLREVLADALGSAPPLSAGPLSVVTEELRELASYQFGRAAAERLLAMPLRLLGRPWFQRITDGHQDLGSVREERGLFHLTVAGARRMGDALACVDVDPSLSLEGDLFAPGVLGADASIRAGDAVGLVQAGRLAGVGEAVLPAGLLGELRHGLAVRVRHRQPKEADTSKTDEVPPLAGR
jgi:archaeosine synthase alpha-subunit